jgi:hypothetical protein
VVAKSEDGNNEYKGIENAEVIITSTVNSSLYYNTQTLANGNFEIKEVPNGFYTLKIQASGYRLFTLDTPFEIQDSDYIFTEDIILIKNQNNSISGFVKLKDNDNKNDIEVSLSQIIDEYKSPGQTTFSDESGKFEFNDIDSGSYIITISATNYETIETELFEINVDENIVFETEFELNPVNNNNDKSIIVNTNRLIGNYPNQFNPSTTIKCEIKNAIKGMIEIFNIKGQKVKTLYDGYLEAGEHSFVWNGDDDNGCSVGSGIYFYKMTTSDYKKKKKMVLMK